MKLLFCLFKYFPFGGLQRDFIRIAQVCQRRGHSIHAITMSWKGEKPQGITISTIPARGLTNHTRCINFAKQVAEYIKKERFDAVVGFNKMPELDVYYAADPCYKARVMKEKGILYRMGNRYRTYLALEKAVLKPSSKTHILLISEEEKENFIKYYHTQEERFHSLTPGISRDRFVVDNVEEMKKGVRRELGIADDEFLLVMVGSGFKTKGLDRSLFAVASLPEALRKKTKLFVIGEGKANPFENIARQLKVSESLYFLGGRDDVPRFMVSADLLLHPAYSENTGTVLIEAMASGLPILATDICGYAHHVREAGAGLLIPSPFKQQVFDELLLRMLTSPEREMWKHNGLHYIRKNDFFSMPEKAADIIESLAKKGHPQ